ncbi:MAG: ATP-binding cassette domain-containing protein, partial [Rhodoplanes sp.]
MSVTLRGVSTVYGSVPMLRDIDIEVGESEIVCVLGPNGAGKSTLFKTVAGLIAPVTGTVRIMNADVAATGTERIARLGVGFVPEGRRLFPGLTVADNIRLGHAAVRPNGSD